MITKETVVPTYPYDYRFQVHDDKYKVVEIELEGEWKVTSDVYANWEYCAADAVIKASKCPDTEFVDVTYPVLAHDMVSDKWLFFDALSKIKTNNKYFVCGEYYDDGIDEEIEKEFETFEEAQKCLYYYERCFLELLDKAGNVLEERTAGL